MFVVFAAPMLSENAVRMVEAAATLYGVRLGVITHDPADALRHLEGSVAHWRVPDILNVDQLVAVLQRRCCVRRSRFVPSKVVEVWRNGEGR